MALRFRGYILIMNQHLTHFIIKIYFMLVAMFIVSWLEGRYILPLLPLYFSLICSHFFLIERFSTEGREVNENLQVSGSSQNLQDSQDPYPSLQALSNCQGDYATGSAVCNSYKELLVCWGRLFGARSAFEPFVDQ